MLVNGAQLPAATSPPQPSPPPAPPPPKPSIALPALTYSYPTAAPNGAALPLVLFGGTTYTTGFPGQAPSLFFPPSGSPYACLPSIVLGGADLTIAVNFSYSSFDGAWARLFDFGVGIASESCVGTSRNSYMSAEIVGNSGTIRVECNLRNQGSHIDLSLPIVVSLLPRKRL